MASRRSHLTLIALLVAALVGVFMLAWSGSPVHKKLRQGLDLQGGLEVVLQAKPPRGHKLTPEDMDISLNVIRNRIDSLGVSEPVVTKQGPNQIVIELPAVHNINQAAAIIGQTAQLELYDLETSLVAPSIDASQNPVATTSLYGLLASVQSGQKGAPAQFYLFNSRTKLPVAGPDDTLAALKNEPAVRKLKPLKPGATKKGALKTTAGFPTGYQVLTVPAGRAVISCDAKSSVVCPGVNAAPAPGVTYYYLFKHTSPSAPNPVPQMTGKDLKLSGTKQDFDPNGNVVVTMHFTGHGNKLFHQITRQEAIRGQTLGTFQHFAIVLDGQLRSFPYIDYKQNPDGINPAGGGAEITGLASVGEAKNLALVLRSGALRVPFETIEQTDVSATLGKDSLRQARNAAIGGLLVVAIFLLLFYRFLGLVAVIGLGIYAAFLYAAILLFNVTLTLPGFAGLILTIGVAADANVVVFERIKEEVRAGKSVRAAIAAGYAKGFHTILDANVVTAITALVLFAVATAQVKGFALMLLIGTVISLITAVAATRAMLGLLAGFRWFNRPRFMGAHGQQTAKWLQIDFMRRRYLWFGISGAILVLGAAALGARGLNLGIDFKGGTQLSFKTPAAHTTGDVRQVMSVQGYGDAVIQGRGKATNDAYKSFQIRTKALSGDKLSQVTTALEDRLQTTAPGATTVSSSFGRQIAKAAITAIIVSLFLVVFYIAIRFDFKFAGPVIVAMLHDVLICIGIYALVGREVTSSTVAAILTVLGYSIYDTIIIFDRIRENIPIMRRSSFATIANVSLWETIRRSLATSFITLLPVGALFLFGGETLKDFAFALIVGIASGAYSSIFVAAPLLTIWKEREPEYERRKDVTVGKAGMEAALEAATERAAEEPAPELAPVATLDGADGGAAAAAAQAKRERRRQRRRARPHGRAR